MYYQTVHNKPIVGGFMSSVYQDLVDFLDNTPVLYELRHPGSQDILRHNLTEIADGMLTYYNVKYIIVHENTTHFQDFFQPNSSGKINQTLQDLFPDNEVVYSDSDIYVLKVDEVRTPLFMKLGRGWLLPSNNTRWMKKQAELVVVSPAAFETKICFEVMAFREGLMQVGTQTFDISNSFNNLSVDVTLSKGENVILFKSPDGCLQEEPCKSFNFKSISIGC
jgi:hypothetical protein